MNNDIFLNVFFNQLGIKFASFLFLTFITYLLSFFVLRIFKVPKRIANLIGGIALLLASYYIITNDFLFFK